MSEFDNTFKILLPLSLTVLQNQSVQRRVQDTQTLGLTSLGVKELLTHAYHFYHFLQSDTSENPLTVSCFPSTPFHSSLTAVKT